MLDSARHQWEEGARRLSREAGDSVRYQQLCDLVERVVEELQRRVGPHFTLSELAGAHSGAADWVREVVRDSAPLRGNVGVRDVALIQDAAFNTYSLAASDYRP